MATITAQRTKEKNKVPYMELLGNLDHSQKLAVIAYLIGSMQENVQANSKRNDIFKNFKSEEDLTDDDRKFLSEKLKEIKISSSVNNLIDHLSLSETEMQDERTKYILGKE